MLLLAAWPAAAVSFGPLMLHVAVDAAPDAAAHADPVQAQRTSPGAGVMQVAFATSTSSTTSAMPELPRLARPTMVASSTVMPLAAEAPRMRSAAGSRQSELALQLQRLEEQIATGNRVLAEMLERVSGMEREVAEMRARVQSLPAVVAARPAAVEPAPQGAPAARQASTAEVDAAERYKRNQIIIDNGLLLLAAGVLLLLVGVAYWTWGRPALKDRLREARAGRVAPAT